MPTQLPSPFPLVPTSWRGQVQELSQSAGLEFPLAKIFVGIFLCYPLGMVMNVLPYGQLRHFFSFLVGAFLMQLLFDVQWIHHLITSLAAYIIFLVLPRKTTTFVVPTLVMLYLKLCPHWRFQYSNSIGKLDSGMGFIAPQMILTQKLYMMAYNLYDGEMLATRQDNRASVKLASYSITRLPSLLEFLGYAFCFSNVLHGPAYEFTIYRNACDGTLFYDANGKARGSIPSNIWPSLAPFLIGLACWIGFEVLTDLFPLYSFDGASRTISPVILATAFLEEPWIYRYSYMYLSLLGWRLNIYFADKLVEGANNVWYAGFEGFNPDGTPKGWQNARNSEIWKVETAPNVQTIFREWNKKTSLWVLRYVYMRSNGNLFLVWGVLALWHDGFYPGYYLYFSSCVLMMACHRVGQRKISPYFPPGKWDSIYGVGCIVVTSCLINYMISSFVLLRFDWSWNTWRSHYFAGHICCMMFVLIVSCLPTPNDAKNKLS